MKNQVENHLFGIELREKYGFNIDPKKVISRSWMRFNDYICVGKFGKEKYGRYIPWSDDEFQPVDEILLKIFFPTGRYIFGEDCPEKLFKKFFDELKTYDPKYSDSVNSELYYTMDNAGKVFNNFDKILNKYYELNKKDVKKRKIEQLKKKMKELEE